MQNPGYLPISFGGFFEEPYAKVLEETSDLNMGNNPYMSHSLNSLKGGYIGDYIGEYHRGY